ncbi:MAG TPA: hypothetical protein VK709_06125 [Candidatus Saccharimonadales bacterium]|jgi:hypothetical protein|nr:hypothetical protein [Candidatus Saccharimonadales bacterium]
MRKRNTILYFFLFAMIFVFAGILFAQTKPSRALIVNGKQQGSVVQMNGHAYIDVETVAQLMNGSVTLEPNRVVLSFPEPQPPDAQASAPAPAPESQQPSQPPVPSGALTRNFASLAIGELAEMREWRGAVGTILTYGVPVVGTWPQDYQNRVQYNLDQVSIAASTPGDGDAMQLLQNEFSNLSRWANDVVSARQSMNATNSVRPDALQSDTALAKIANCSRFLSSMLVSGTFADDQSCH